MSNRCRLIHGLIGLASILIAGWHCAAQDVLGLRAERAFPNLRIRRPVVLTHAGDGTNRLFVVTQQGQIHVFDNDQNVMSTEVFLDIEARVQYHDRQNEEGLLGLAFHPNFKENGQFFVYYTLRNEGHTSVISRFHVDTEHPNRADPASEEEVLRIEQPYWNHNGGTIEFGPDGYLYVGLGDGGNRDDPHGNGQNLATLLGSILRIDVDHKDPGLGYAIPKDNPFVRGDRPNARGEIWAYGFRNVWRLSFDRETGDLWAADVGQDIWEEVNVVTRGGNYGWNLREARHRFGPRGADANPSLIDPVWEYHHEVGKSITGGCVYRGKRLPKLWGAYLCADYVSGKLWALRYDKSSRQLTDMNQIAPEDPLNPPPVVTFGEDEEGEVYFTTAFGMIYRFSPVTP